MVKDRFVKFMNDEKYPPEEINQECVWSYFISNYIDTISFLSRRDYFEKLHKKNVTAQVTNSPKNGDMKYHRRVWRIIFTYTIYQIQEIFFYICNIANVYNLCRLSTVLLTLVFRYQRLNVSHGYQKVTLPLLIYRVRDNNVQNLN